MANGLTTPTMKKENDILSATRKAFGKLYGKPRTLEQRLQGLTEQELGRVVQTAQFVKMAHSFGNLSPSVKATEALEKPPAAKPSTGSWTSDSEDKPRMNASYKKVPYCFCKDDGFLITLTRYNLQF